ncbi:MAG: hypothetical protein KTR32_10825 [Granulosicoccus sp.]|nr:hypothetical protein [Granulosicoccus sp.]
MLGNFRYCLLAGLLIGTGTVNAANDNSSSNTNTNESTAGITGFDLKFINDSNPAKAEFERDIEESNSFMGRVSANILSKDLSQSASVPSGLSLNASASFEHNADIEDLGESRYRLSADWFRENNLSTLAPFYRLSLGLGYLDSETQIRDSVIIDVSASANVQPTNFFDSTLGISLEAREADTEVFDTTKATLFLTGNFSPASRLVLRAGLRVVLGNEVSTATPTLNIVNTAEAIEPDGAFGGRDENRFAYLLDATSTIFEVGAGFLLTDALETNLLYRVISTSADNDIGYDRNMLELTFSYSL